MEIAHLVVKCPYKMNMYNASCEKCYFMVYVTVQIVMIELLHGQQFSTILNKK